MRENALTSNRFTAETVKNGAGIGEQQGGSEAKR